MPPTSKITPLSGRLVVGSPSSAPHLLPGGSLSRQPYASSISLLTPQGVKRPSGQVVRFAGRLELPAIAQWWRRLQPMTSDRARPRRAMASGSSSRRRDDPATPVKGGGSRSEGARSLRLPCLQLTSPGARRSLSPPAQPAGRVDRAFSATGHRRSQGGVLSAKQRRPPGSRPGLVVVRRTGTVAKNWISSATSSNRSSRRTHEEIKRPESSPRLLGHPNDIVATRGSGDTRSTAA
jgi:hypothetical protein